MQVAALIVPTKRGKTTASHRGAPRFQRYRVLYRISDLINSTTRTDTLLRRILRETNREMGATSGSVWLATNDRKSLELNVYLGDAAQRPKTDRRPITDGTLGEIVLKEQVVYVSDVVHGPHAEFGDAQAGSTLGVPLRVENSVIGALIIHAPVPGAFGEGDKKLLAAIGNQAAKVIQTSRLYDRIAEQGRRIEALFEVGQALIAPNPLPVLLKQITTAVHGLLEIKLCSVMVLNDRKELVLSAVSGQEVQYAQQPSLAIDRIHAGDLAYRHQPLEVFKVQKATRQRRGTGTPGYQQSSSLVSLPIFYHDRLIGFLNIYKEDHRQLSEEDTRLLDAFASLCGIAIENAQRYERVLKAEQSIRQTDRLATLGILSAEIAHEVRNPISIISMLLHSLVEDKAVAPSREKDVSIITEKLERIDRIVSQVLNFGKKREPRYEWLDVNVLLEELLFLVNHALAARLIELRLSLTPDLPGLLGDRGDFDQIFLNLIMNAVDAMPNGGILSVKTSTDQDGASDGHVSVVIRDTGRGIEPESIPHLFSPFYSTRPEGFGLGLFVSNKLLGQYDGHIAVKSTPGRGTTFSVHIPVEARKQ